jgi:hypothetical protein
MTNTILKKIPEQWLSPDEDGDRIADSFSIGMELEVSTKGNHCRVYQPKDADIPFECLQYVSGDFDSRFLSNAEAESLPTQQRNW